MKEAYCVVSIAPLRAEAADQSEIVSQLLFGEPIEVAEINAPWAKVRSIADGYEGYIDHKHLHLLSKKEFKRWMDGLSYQKCRQRLL